MFFGLGIALSGLRAHQQAMDVTAHNIANAGTEGYHRQQPVFISGNPLLGSFSLSAIGSPQLGTGVLVHSIRRMQSTYIDSQVRTARQALGNWDYKNATMKQVESILAEPGDYGLEKVLNKFWNSWHETDSPSNIVQNGIALTQKIKNLYDSLRQQQTTTNDDIINNAGEINRLAKEIAKLNEQIRGSSALGYQPNDLMDRRDILLDELSSITRIKISGAGGAELMVSISGKNLIQGNTVTEVSVVEGPSGWAQIVWSDDGSPVVSAGGEISGQIEMRDVILQGYIDALNKIASMIVTEVNKIYSTGLTPSGDPAGDFFVAGGDASNIEVTPALVAMPTSLVTSTTGNPGDNDVALAIADLQTTKTASGLTINQEYIALVAQIGSDSQESGSRVDNYNLTMRQLQIQRESVSGVSLDEEMANMVKFQQSYNASARMFTVMDEMMDTVINKLGTVGR